MTQTSYSFETLEAAFPPLTAPLKPKGGHRGSVGSIQSLSSQPRKLDEMINAPPGTNRSADTLRFAGEAARQGWTRQQVREVLLDPSKAISAHCLDQGDPERAADRAIEKAFAEQPVIKPVVFTPTPYVWVPREKIPPLDWLFGHWILRNEVTFLVAPGGVGKTTLLAATALSLATGKNFLGKYIPGGPKRVWFWNLEDNIDMMTRSIAATAFAHGIGPGDLGDRLCLNSARDGDPLCTAERTRDGLVVRQDVHNAIVAALLEKQIDVLIVDPFVSSHAANENDNGEMDRVAKAWCQVAQEADCAVILCHHTSKFGAAEVNTMSARGAVALTAAARAVLVLNQMTTVEANRLGLDEDERKKLVQVTMDKSNRAPLGKADWFRKISVPLGHNDNAAAFTPWSPPAASDLLTPQTIQMIRSAIGDADLRESPQAEDWGGYIVAATLGLARPEPATPERGKIGRIMAELVKQGHLIKATGKDRKSKSVPVLRLAPPISPPAHNGVEISGAVEKFKE